MKKRVALLLVFMMLFTLLAVPTYASEFSNFKTYTFTDYKGSRIEFSAALTGYVLNYSDPVNDGLIRPVIILKDNSTFKLDAADEVKFYDEEQKSYGILNYPLMLSENGIDTDGLPEIHDYRESVIFENQNNVKYLFDSESLEEDTEWMAEFRDSQNVKYFIMTESTANRFSKFISRDNEQPKRDILFKLDNEKSVGTGVSYDYTLTNNSNTVVEGCYAAVMYCPYVGANDAVYAEIKTFDVSIKPYSSVKGEYVSSYRNLVENFEILWIKFDSKEEKNSFIAESPLTQDENQKDKYNVKTDSGKWFEETMSVTLK